MLPSLSFSDWTRFFVFEINHIWIYILLLHFLLHFKSVFYFFINSILSLSLHFYYYLLSKSLTTILNLFVFSLTLSLSLSLSLSISLSFSLFLRLSFSLTSSGLIVQKFFAAFMVYQFNSSHPQNHTIMEWYP